MDRKYLYLFLQVFLLVLNRALNVGVVLKEVSSYRARSSFFLLMAMSEILTYSFFVDITSVHFYC
jgi:hypothetical protein